MQPAPSQDTAVQQQTPPEQDSPGAQALPQSPQLFGSIPTSLQLPEQQVPPPAPQTLPHDPQLFGSTFVFAHTPPPQ